MNTAQVEVARFIREEVSRAMREGRRFRGETTLYKVDVDMPFTVPEEFCWLKTCKYGSQADVSAADRANTKFDLKVNNEKLNYDQQLDTELIQMAEHPFEWPIMHYLPAGTKIEFDGATANSSTSYFVLHGFRPIKATLRQMAKRPFIYSMAFENCTQNTAYSDTLEILPDTTLYVTNLIALQRCRFEVGGVFTNYLVEANDVSIEMTIMNRPVNMKSISTGVMFGSPSYPYTVDAPIPIRGGTTILLNINTPAFGASERDIYLYFVGVEVNSTNVLTPIQGIQS
jgi:hypothetical protein